MSSDKYSLTSAQNTLDQAKLTLKQLLELDINEELNIAFPEIKDEEVLQPVADKSQIYNTALASRPEIKSGQMNIKVAELSLGKSKAAYYPTISLSGSIGTGNLYNSNEKFTTQLGNSLTQSLGISVSIPIFNNRQTKSAVEKAEYAIKNAQLDYTAAQKTLLKNIETTYQDVISSQSRYTSAKDKVRSSEVSYSLINDQFNLGMKNTVELLTAKTTYMNDGRHFRMNMYFGYFVYIGAFFIVFYLNYLYLINRFLFDRKTVRFIIVNTLSIAACSLLLYWYRSVEFAHLWHETGI